MQHKLHKATLHAYRIGGGAAVVLILSGSGAFTEEASRQTPAVIFGNNPGGKILGSDPVFRFSRRPDGRCVAAAIGSSGNDAVDLACVDVGQQPLQCRAFDVAAGESAVVVVFRQADPALWPLADNRLEAGDGRFFLMRDHTKLRAFELADRTALAVYECTRDFPREEQFGLTSQMRRSAVSIASNIVEGCARDSLADYVRFLDMAYGSARELEYQISLAKRLGYLAGEGAERLLDLTIETCKVLNGLIRSLRHS